MLNRPALLCTLPYSRNIVFNIYSSDLGEGRGIEYLGEGRAHSRKMVEVETSRDLHVDWPDYCPAAHV